MDIENTKIENRKISKSPGQNKSEQYLAKLCNRTFLSLWSYPNLYHAKGQELSDLLVIFGNYILIFSDKTRKYPTTDNPKINWTRWLRKAVAESAKQLWGAERWIKQYPGRIFLDSQCFQIFPFDIDVTQARIHLILVAHGASEACKGFFGNGSGSLMIRNDVKGVDAHTAPFIIGDIDPTKTFIHILDDTTLDIVMSALNTVSDFTSYLGKKEALLRSGKNIFATGEEDLPPYYMTKMKGKEHDFDFPKDSDEIASIAILEGGWDRFCENPQRKAQLEEDKISYFWDALIEQFNIHALNSTQYMVSAGGVKDSEKVMRFFASESRFKRRLLSKAVLGLIKKTPENIYGRRFIVPQLDEKGPYYVFVAFPRKKEYTEEEYRAFRGRYLEVCCMVVRSVYPEAKDIIGFATEAGKFSKGKSEDAIYFDGRHWNNEMQKEAEELQTELEILVDPTYHKVHYTEFPDVSDKQVPKVGRNEKCPCGLGVKYKKCHGINS